MAREQQAVVRDPMFLREVLVRLLSFFKPATGDVSPHEAYQTTGDLKSADLRDLQSADLRGRFQGLADAVGLNLTDLEREAWGIKQPKSASVRRMSRHLQKVPRRNRGFWGDRILDDGTEIEILDSAWQLLTFRCGPVYSKDNVQRVPGIWINYQRRYGATTLHGAFLLSPALFQKIARMLGERVRHFRPSLYGKVK